MVTNTVQEISESFKYDVEIQSPDHVYKHESLKYDVEIQSSGRVYKKLSTERYQVTNSLYKS